MHFAKTNSCNSHKLIVQWRHRPHFTDQEERLARGPRWHSQEVEQHDSKPWQWGTSAPALRRYAKLVLSMIARDQALPYRAPLPHGRKAPWTPGTSQWTEGSRLSLRPRCWVPRPPDSPLLPASLHPWLTSSASPSPESSNCPILGSIQRCHIASHWRQSWLYEPLCLSLKDIHTK